MSVVTHTGGSRLPYRACLRGTLLAAALLVMAVAGCSAGRPAAVTTQSAAAESPFQNVGVMPKLVNGATFDQASVTGKPVVLWFWAPWCTFCREEGPAVAKLAGEYDGRVAIIGVAGQDTLSAMRSFVAQTKTGGIPHLADVTGTLWRDYGISVQPAFAFISRDGRAQVRVGDLDEQTLRGKVAELAAGSPISSVSITPGGICSKGPDGALYCSSGGPGRSATTPVPTTSP